MASARNADDGATELDERKAPGGLRGSVWTSENTALRPTHLKALATSTRTANQFWWRRDFSRHWRVFVGQKLNRDLTCEAMGLSDPWGSRGAMREAPRDRRRTSHGTLALRNAVTTSARKRHLQNVRGPRGGRKRRHGLTNAVGTQLRNIGTKHFPCDIGRCHVFEHGTRMKSTTALEKEIGCSWAGAAQTRRSAPSWTRCDHRGSATNLRMTALGGPHRHLQRLKISPGADVGCVQRPGKGSQVER